MVSFRVYERRITSHLLTESCYRFHDRLLETKTLHLDCGIGKVYEAFLAKLHTKT